MSNFQPLEVVGRGSEKQIQVGENLNIFTQQEKGSVVAICVCDVYLSLSHFDLIISE